MSAPARKYDAKVISLVLTEKEAVALHLLYSLGSSALCGDADERFLRETASAVFDAYYSREEKRGLAAKITQLAHSISAETKVEMTLRVGMRALSDND